MCSYFVFRTSLQIWHGPEVKCICRCPGNLVRHDISVHFLYVIGMNGIFEITIPIMDTGCIKPIISSMLKSVEFLTPHTGLSIFNYICIVICNVIGAPHAILKKNSKKTPILYTNKGKKMVPFSCLC